MNDIKSITKVQSIARGWLSRRNRLPNAILNAQKILINSTFDCDNESKDGRTGSTIDEETIINILTNHIPNNRIKISKNRMWHDLQLYDTHAGWLPVNIKSSKIAGASDNVGTIALCLYTYTSHNINLDKNYNGGKVTPLLLDDLKNRKWNTSPNRDYYFLVVNKNNTNDVIANSILGLSNISPNLHNLPFQVCWRKNREYKRTDIKSAIIELTRLLKKTKLTWQEKLTRGMAELDINNRA